MSSNIPVATWALGPTTRTAAESALDTSPVIRPPGSESVLLGDKRTLVKPADIKPGGKYYSIVKLQMKYEGQDPDDTRYAMGTGWLIAPDLLVTAGHCAYDHQYGFGRAIEVKAYVGYHGKEFVDTDKNVQFRRGVKIATTKNWINSEVNRANDVSFIRVETPFNSIVSVKWQKTPVTGDRTLGVVGYPADRTSKSGEQGAEMWEMFATTHVDLQTTPSNMLEYLISTYAGQSGSPVLVQDSPQLTSIGAHVYGLGNRNSASVIRGQYGNDFGAYIGTFDANSKFQTITTVAGVTYLNVPPQSQEADLGERAESFGDIFRKVIDIGTQIGPRILQVGTPFLGTQAVKIAGAVGTALSVANELTKSKAPGTESGFEPPLDYKSYAARAVLAESVLQHVIHGAATPNKLAMYKAMQKSFEENKAQIKPVAKRIGPYLLDPALRILVAETAPKTGEEASIMSQYPRIGDARTLKGVSDGQKKAFVEALNKVSSSKVGQEGFLDFLSPLASLAVNVVGSGVSAVAKAIGGGESSLTEGPTPPDTLQAHIETLCHRALMAEAALQAAMAIPVTSHEEGFFGDLVNVIKDVGSTVIKVAPSVIQAVTPIVKSFTESSMPVPTGGQAGTSNKPLVKQPSIADLVRGGKPIPTPDTAPSAPGAPSLADLARSGKSFRVAERSAVNGLGETRTFALLEAQEDGVWGGNPPAPKPKPTAHV